MFYRDYSNLIKDNLGVSKTGEDGSIIWNYSKFMKTTLTKFMRKYDPTFQDKNIRYVHLVTKARSPGNESSFTW